MVDEGGGDQQRAQRLADRLEERQAVFEGGLRQRRVGFQLALRERPPERARPKARHDIDDVLVGRLGEHRLAGLVELDPRQQCPYTARRPVVEERPLDRHRPECDALPRVVLHVAVRREVRHLVVRWPVRVGQRGSDQVTRAQVGRDFDDAALGFHEVERADQAVQRGGRNALLVAVEEGQRDRRRRLVGVGVDRHPVPARHVDEEALGHAVEGVGRAALEEHDRRVVDDLDDAGAEVLADRVPVQVGRLLVLDLDGPRLGPRAGPERLVERAGRGGQVAADVERRDALVLGHHVETAGVRLFRQVVGQARGDIGIDAQEILDRVLVLQPGEPPQRRSLTGTFRAVRFK